MLVSGAVIGLVSVTLWVHSAVTQGGPFDGRAGFLLLAVAGLALEFAGAWVHDRGHRRRGESPTRSGASTTATGPTGSPGATGAPDPDRRAGSPRPQPASAPRSRTIPVAPGATSRNPSDS